jgi:catechol 2,3-dioxygenase-like lactoylglutathione lyase family enzyme
MAHKFHHGHIKSPDPRKTARWWADMFGAKLMPEHGSGSALFAPIEIDGVLINVSGPSEAEAVQMGEGNANLHYGLEHLALATDDLDTDLARLREQGLEVFEVRESPTTRMAWVETPDKVRVELIQYVE